MESPLPWVHVATTRKIEWLDGHTTMAKSIHTSILGGSTSLISVSVTAGLMRNKRDNLLETVAEVVIVCACTAKVYV